VRRLYALRTRVHLLTLSPIPVTLLRCPVTMQPLRVASGGSHLITPDGMRSYPIKRGVPILLAPEISDVSATDYGSDAVQLLGGRLPIERVLRRIMRGGPTITSNVSTAANLALLRDLLIRRAAETGTVQRLLIVGGATPGVGMHVLADCPSITIISTDLAIGPETDIVCDAAHLPFAEAAFDAVLCQAVLEHVPDPPAAVSEMHRVGARGGFIYSEVPFMQQVHEGAYDVTRYTLMGHRWLMRNFDEIASGAQNGPGMALAWSIQYFLTSFTTSRLVRSALIRLSSLTLFWLKYCDARLVDKPGGLDAAAGTYFLGRRREAPLTSREVFDGYRGMVRNSGRTMRE
jgi:uncharacterized protein YbaR (Trm112 family)/SAM-dependent methyltransferase